MLTKMGSYALYEILSNEVCVSLEASLTKCNTIDENLIIFENV